MPGGDCNVSDECHFSLDSALVPFVCIYPMPAFILCLHLSYACIYPMPAFVVYPEAIIRWWLL